MSARKQKTTGVRLRTATAGKGHGSTKDRNGRGSSAGTSNGAAPPPTLSEASNPLNGVLPTSLLTLPGPGTNLPDFFIQSFHVPTFLLPIYQAAATEYGIPWTVLAAINEVETDYGRDLSISSAGAEGWMQFLPVEWKQYGVDATGSGYADPYNPADAIFAAARYLAAAGGQTNIKQAIYAYNHSAVYVESVLLRSELLAGAPTAMIDQLTSLADGHFPIQPHDHPTYDSGAPATASAASTPDVVGAAPALTSPLPTDTSKSVDIYARPGAAVVAVQDGVITRIGWSKKVGRYIMLRDESGNTYIYGNLEHIESRYLLPNAPQIASLPAPSDASPVPDTPAPTAAATAGDHPPAASTSTPAPTAPSGAGPGSSTLTPAAAGVEFGTIDNPLSLLLAGTVAPAAPASPLAAAAGDVASKIALPSVNATAATAQTSTSSAATSPAATGQYFTADYGLPRSDLTLHQLRKGANVLAGTILGRIGPARDGQDPHLVFELRPGGGPTVDIDPRPFLDAWSQLETVNLHRHAGTTPLVGPDALSATAGRVMLLPKPVLQRVVLGDPHITLDACARADIGAGRVDRRVLALLEYLVITGLDPTVGNVACSADGLVASADATPGATNGSVDVTAINGIPVAGHQGSGSITETAILRLLQLQGDLQPSEIISEHALPNAPSTVGLPDHNDRIEIVYNPLGTAGTPQAAAASVTTTAGFALSAQRWGELVDRLQQIPQPVISPVRSAASVHLGLPRHKSH